MSICLEKVKIAKIAGIIYTENIVVTCQKSKFGSITLLVFSCMFEYPTNVFSHFYTPTLAVFRKISDRFRLSQNFEKRDFIMFPLTVLVSKPPNRTYSNCHFIKDFEENYLVLRFLWLSRMYLMLVKRWFVFVKMHATMTAQKLN